MLDAIAHTGLALKESHEPSRKLDGILPDTASEELKKWWNKMLMNAKEICEDPQGKLINSDVLLAKSAQNKSEDVEKGRDCVRKAIQQNLKSMPNITGEVFMQIIETFVDKRKT
jgi:hypothetical protein